MKTGGWCLGGHPVLGGRLPLSIPPEAMDQGLFGELSGQPVTLLSPCVLQYPNLPTQLTHIKISFADFITFLFVSFMKIICKPQPSCGGLGIESLLFTEEVVQLAPSDCDFSALWDSIAAESESSRGEGQYLPRLRPGYSQQTGSESLIRANEFKDLRVWLCWNKTSKSQLSQRPDISFKYGHNGARLQRMERDRNRKLALFLTGLPLFQPSSSFMTKSVKS